ncbi:MAG: DUF5107 domain-containing protein [Abitibacteriaceae bacterium]|nr:DUF5107 domain-containing protein [Abditibacteriaceae bacterium]MBV9866122.1 DUF5107 domain-containing protein [Abditibacteriaceae bacterium]
MNELRFESYYLPAADLGPENPLPSLQRLRGVNFVQEVEDDIPAEDRAYLGYGFDISLLPYRMQDGYERQRKRRAFQAAVLENEVLRATFLPELGGRLWSLYHKPSQRELLYCNPVFQPANLATRNAWFSGGVEWNIGVPGHSPLTCSPLFAARLNTPEGEPVLCLFEWERVRQVPFRIDAYLPSGSPMLFVRVSITNPHDEITPMYWWSNIAVPEHPSVRVVTPTDYAYKNAYRGGLQRVSVPLWENTDITYSTNLDAANDFFFRIPDGQRPWIAALDGQGTGLVQTSTARLQARKLFVWGMSPGGRRWQEYLSVPDRPYIEIQAGLARTQSHCLPMPPQAQWSWLEAYGLLEADGPTIHGSDWAKAWTTVDETLERLLPVERMAAIDQQLSMVASTTPATLHQMGSGWGTLEQLRREAMQETPLLTPDLSFPATSLGADQAPWLNLLQNGELPYQDPAQEPGAWMVQTQWRELLERAVQAGHGDHWLSWLHLGVMYYAAGQLEAVRDAWTKSLQHEPSAWALRNLAVLAQDEKQYEAAAALYEQAVDLAPHVTRLVIECCEALLGANRAAAVPPLLETVPSTVQAHSRVQLLRARAALQLDDLETVAAILRQPLEFADIREGEVSLTDLWFGMHEKRLAQTEGVAIDESLRRRVRAEYPPPAELDFRLSGS